jgi:cell division protease FtsH
MLTPQADPVREVSIIPRGGALGVTLSTPDSDRVSYSKGELEAQIKVALGGRVAEEVVFSQITTGAESDLDHLTQIARQMVGRWGMSDQLGPITVLPSDGTQASWPSSDPSPQTHWVIDQEVQQLVNTAHREVTQLLSDHRPQLDRLTTALLKAETLDAVAPYAAAEVQMPRPTADGQESSGATPPPTDSHSVEALHNDANGHFSHSHSHTTRDQILSRDMAVPEVTA